MTRESVEVQYESGASLYFDASQGVARHMIAGADEVFEAFPLPMTLQLNVWYDLTFSFDGASVNVEVDGEVVFTAPAVGFNPAAYTQPHIAVFNGLALFESVWLEQPAITATTTTSACPEPVTVTQTETQAIRETAIVYQPYPVYIEATVTLNQTRTIIQDRFVTSTVWVAVMTETVTVTSTLQVPIPEQQGAGSFMLVLTLGFCVSLWMMRRRRKVRSTNA